MRRPGKNERGRPSEVILMPYRDLFRRDPAGKTNDIALLRILPPRVFKDLIGTVTGAVDIGVISVSAQKSIITDTGKNQVIPVARVHEIISGRRINEIIVIGSRDGVVTLGAADKRNCPENAFRAPYRAVVKFKSLNPSRQRNAVARLISE